MDFPRPSQSAGSLIGGIKDRLGFNKKNDRDEYYDEAYYDEGFDDFSDDYDSYAYAADDGLEYTTRSTSRYRDASSPHLVSAEDVRATTSAFGVTPRETSSASSYMRSTSSISPAHRSSVSHISDVDIDGLDKPATDYRDFVSPYQTHDTQTRTSSVAPASSTTHSAGLDSLFTPSTSASTTSTTSTSAVNDPYTAYETGSSFTMKAQREFHVIRPAVYQDVQSIARIVRSGDVVVLALRSTNDALAKRVLDFSFGVASALDASVECIADKMFTITQGSELTLDEKHRARQQAQR